MFGVSGVNLFQGEQRRVIAVPIDGRHVVVWTGKATSRQRGRRRIYQGSDLGQGGALGFASRYIGDLVEQGWEARDEKRGFVLPTGTDPSPFIRGTWFDVPDAAIYELRKQLGINANGGTEWMDGCWVATTESVVECIAREGSPADAFMQLMELTMPAGTIHRTKIATAMPAPSPKGTAAAIASRFDSDPIAQFIATQIGAIPRSPIDWQALAGF